MDTRYITSAAKPEQLPDFDQAEIAFIGRSNTGKSSLINALLGRRNLARMGRTPGQTQMINFFAVNEKVIVADLPGYGYNVARKETSKHWQPLVDCYVRRPNISAFLCLHDCRRNLQEMDEELFFLLGRQLPITLVLTKVDKCSRNELKSNRAKIEKRLKELGVNYDLVLETSSLKNQGVDLLRERILNPLLSEDQAD